MAREKKDSKVLNIKLASDINDMLLDICSDSGLTKTAVVEKAITAFAADYREKQEILKQNSR